MKKLLKIAAIVIGTLTVLSLIPLGMLGTEWGTQQIYSLANKFVRPLHLAPVTGTFLAGMHSDQLTWESNGVRIEVSDINTNIHYRCLWRNRICLGNTSLGSIDIETGSNDSSEKTTGMPDVRLPVSLVVDFLKVDQMRYRKADSQNPDAAWTSIGSDIELSETRWLRTRLTTTDAQWNLAGVHASVSGSLGTTKGWPADLNTRLKIDALGDQFVASGPVSGDFNSLKLNLMYSGYGDGALNGSVQPLAPGLPADARLSVNSPPEQLNPYLTPLEHLNLSLNGTDSGYRISATGRFDNSQPLQAQATMTFNGIHGLSLTVGKSLSLKNAALQWLPELTLRGNLQLTDFHTPDVWPVRLSATARADLNINLGNQQDIQADGHIDELQYQQFEVSQADISGKWRVAEDTYELKADGRISVPDQPRTRLTIDAVSYDRRRWHLNDLSLDSSIGRQSLKGMVETPLKNTEQISWDINGSFSNTNLAFWFPQLPSFLQGEFSSRGEWKDKGIDSLSLKSEVSGTALHRSFASSTDITKQSGRPLQVSTGHLRWGATVASLKGTLDETGAALNLYSGNLSEFTAAAGHNEMAARGQLYFSDRAAAIRLQPDQLHLDMDINPEQARNLNLMDNKLRLSDLQASLSVDLAAPFNYSARLRAGNWQAGNVSFGAVQVNSEGQSSEQTLQVRHKGDSGIDLDLLSRPGSNGSWSGKLSQLALFRPDNYWQLEKPVDLSYQDQSFQLNRTCLSQADARLCADFSSTTEQLKTSGQVKDLDPSALTEFTGITTYLSGTGNGSWNLTIPLDHFQPAGQAAFSINQGQLVSDGTHYPFHDGALQLKLTDSNIRAEASFISAGGRRFSNTLRARYQDASHLSLSADSRIDDQHWLRSKDFAVVLEPGAVSLKGDLNLDQAPLEYLGLPSGSRLSSEAHADLTLYQQPVSPGDWLSQLQGNLELNNQTLLYQGQSYPHTIHARFDRKQAEIDASLKTTQLGHNQLRGKLGATITPDQWALRNTSLWVDTARIRASGSGSLKPGYNSRLTLSSSQIQPGLFFRGWNGDLESEINLAASYEHTFKWSSTGRIKGYLKQQKLNSNWSLEGNGSLLTAAHNTGLHWGDTHLLLSRADQQHPVIAELSAPQLSQWDDRLDGDLLVNAQVQPGAESTDVEMRLSGTRLRYQAIDLEHYNASMDINRERDALNLSLSWEDLITFGNHFHGLTARVSGSPEKHRLIVNQQGSPGHGMIMDASWNRENNDWNGTLEWARLNLFGKTWQTDREVTLRHQGSENDISANCWKGEDASICLDKFHLGKQKSAINARIDNVGIGRLVRSLSQGWSAEGNISGEIDLASENGVLNGYMAMNMPEGEISISDDQTTQHWPLENVSLLADAEDRNIRTRLSLGLGDESTVMVENVIDRSDRRLPLSGEIQISHLPMALAAPLLHPQDKVAGQLDISASLSGRLLEPSVDGSFHLSDGQLQMIEYPVNLENLDLNGTLNNTEASWKGEFNHPDRSDDDKATTSGTFSWGDGLHLSSSVKADNWPLEIRPYADLVVSPDMTIDVSGDTIGLYGELAIDRGKIIINELPKQAVTPSEDVVFVGEENKQTSGKNLKARLHITSTDRVEFTGYGLTGKMVGDLVLMDNYQARGQVDIEDGQFSKFGTELDLSESYLTFTGEVTEPNLHALGTQEITDSETDDDYTIGIQVSGTLSNPAAEIYSDPYLPPDIALSYLVLGRAPNATSEDQNQVDQAALALGVFGSRTFGQALADDIGLKGFDLDSEGSGDDTKVIASGQISDRLEITYGVGVYESGSQIGFRYELLKKLFLEAAQGYESSLSLFYTFEYD